MWWCDQFNIPHFCFCTRWGLCFRIHVTKCTRCGLLQLFHYRCWMYSTIFTPLYLFLSSCRFVFYCFTEVDWLIANNTTFDWICVVTSTRGSLYALIDGSDRSNILISVFEIITSDFESMEPWILNGTEVLLNATSNNPNEWIEFFAGPAGIVFSVVFTSLSASLAIFALVKLIMFLKLGMKILSIPIVSLFAEFLASSSEFFSLFLSLSLISSFNYLFFFSHFNNNNSWINRYIRMIQSFICSLSLNRSFCIVLCWVKFVLLLLLMWLTCFEHFLGAYMQYYSHSVFLSLYL